MEDGFGIDIAVPGVELDLCKGDVPSIVRAHAEFDAGVLWTFDADEFAVGGIERAVYVLDEVVDLHGEGEGGGGISKSGRDAHAP